MEQKKLAHLNNLHCTSCIEHIGGIVVKSIVTTSFGKCHHFTCKQCGKLSQETKNKNGYPARYCKRCKIIWFYTNCDRCSAIIDERFSKPCSCCPDVMPNIWRHCPQCSLCKPRGNGRECTCDGSCK